MIGRKIRSPSYRSASLPTVDILIDGNATTFIELPNYILLRRERREWRERGERGERGERERGEREERERRERGERKERGEREERERREREKRERGRTENISIQSWKKYILSTICPFPEETSHKRMHTNKFHRDNKD